MEDLGRLIKLRREKLDELREMGISPYINRFHVNTTLSALVEKYSEKSKEELDEKNSEYITAGRMMSRRKHGKTTFVNIKDASGDIQVFINKNSLGESAYEIFGKFDDFEQYQLEENDGHATTRSHYSPRRKGRMGQSSICYSRPPIGSRTPYPLKG